MTTPQISLGRVTLVDALASPYAYAHRVPCCIHSLLVGRGIVIGGIRVGQVRSNAEVCSGVLWRAGACLGPEFRRVWDENLMLEGRLGQESNAEAC